MVFFCCDGCGETLKKNQVDGHANRCRRCDAVSCVDCAVSFFGDDYRTHTSCMTEAERYEGKLAKPVKRNPQQEWTDIVESCVSMAPPHLIGYMETMAGLDNIPRKEKQFRNFTANSLKLRGRDEVIVGEIWNVLKVEREKRQAAKEIKQKAQKKKQEESKRKQAEEAADSKEKETSSKRKEQSPSDEEDETPKDSPPIDPKAVQKAMKKALKKAPNRSMKLKELRKLLGDELSLTKSAKKQLKKLLLDAPTASKKAKIKVDGKVVTLV